MEPMSRRVAKGRSGKQVSPPPHQDDLYHKHTNENEQVAVRAPHVAPIIRKHGEPTSSMRDIGVESFGSPIAHAFRGERSKETLPVEEEDMVPQRLLPIRTASAASSPGSPKRNYYSDPSDHSNASDSMRDGEPEDPTMELTTHYSSTFDEG